MEVTILTLFSNRPDFIRPQYNSFKRHLKDVFTYTVVNNAYFDNDASEEINRISQEEGTGYLRIMHEKKKNDISHLVADTLNFLWKDFKDTKGILAIMDCDIFMTAPISFTDLLDGYDMAFCPLYTAGKVWPWTGLMLFDMDKIKEGMNFGFASLDTLTYQDVGSAVHKYIAEHHPNIRYLDRKELLDQDWPVRGNHTLYTLNFPQPYSVDIISINQYPFLFHYKTSSNYAPHCTKEYNEKKTKALELLLT